MRSRFLRPGWIVIYGILLVVTRKLLFAFSSFEFNEKIIIEKGDTLEKMYDTMPPWSVLKVRWYLNNNTEALQTLQLGSYVFSGNYTPSSFVQTINKGPTRSFSKVTILEGRSIYDIDEHLSSKGMISPGEYIHYVSSADTIQDLSSKYDFVHKFTQSKPEHVTLPTTLEGLLYPDTYHLSDNQPLISQLVALQLQAFRDKVVEPYSSQIESFSSSLQSQGYSFSLGWYNIITLASIIEKEERSDQNKPIIAGIFLNRIQQGMRIDADVTLCYGLKKGYESCTPSLIAQSVSDTSNIYNTRQQKGLTPTPIANPAVNTIDALLRFQKTDNIFYLHDSAGRLRTARDIQGHNTNKANHL